MNCSVHYCSDNYDEQRCKFLNKKQLIVSPGCDLHNLDSFSVLVAKCLLAIFVQFVRYRTTYTACCCFDDAQMTLSTETFHMLISIELALLGELVT